MAGCRDCCRCTESFLTGLIYLPFRLAWGLATFWNIGLVARKCPQCRHGMGRHRMVRGRYQD